MLNDQRLKCGCDDPFRCADCDCCQRCCTCGNEELCSCCFAPSSEEPVYANCFYCGHLVYLCGDCMIRYPLNDPDEGLEC
jgi:hypothetical protein